MDANAFLFPPGKNARWLIHPVSDAPDLPTQRWPPKILRSWPVAYPTLSGARSGERWANSSASRWSSRTALAPIGIVTDAPNVLAIHAGLPFKSLAELFAFAKANPGKLSYGSAGVGSIGHLSGELLRSVTGCDMVHVPYKTSAAAYPDAIGGNVSMVFDTLPAAINHIKAGKVRALAVLSPRMHSRSASPRSSRGSRTTWPGSRRL